MANEAGTMEGCEVKTLEDVGRYLQKMREGRRVTQTGLSAKIAAVAGRRIGRSRISEIENARRDRITERELRLYMLGLKCTHSHIDQMMKALRQCTATRRGVSTADPASISSAMPDFHPAGLVGAEGDVTMRREKADDDPTAIRADNENREFSPLPETCTESVDTSPPQPHGSRDKPSRTYFFAVMALVIVGCTVINIGFVLRHKNVDMPAPSATNTILLVPPNTPLASDDTSNLIESAISPGWGSARTDDKRFTKTSQLQGQPIVANPANRDTAKQEVRRCCIDTGQPQAVDTVELLNAALDWLVTGQLVELRSVNRE